MLGLWVILWRGVIVLRLALNNGIEIKLRRRGDERDMKDLGRLAAACQSHNIFVLVACVS